MSPASKKARPIRYLMTATVMAVLAPPADAGGLYLREFGQPSQAMSGAGANVLTEDASTAFQNPAGLFDLKKDTNWMVTGISVIPEVKFDQDGKSSIEGVDGGDAGSAQWGAAVFFTHRLDETWGAGVALNSYSGSGVDYGSHFAGRYLGYETELLTISLAPNIAYRLNDSVSFAAGFSLQYGELDLRAAVPPLLGPAVPDRDGRVEVRDGDDYDIALSVSGLWQVNEAVRLGIVWLGERTLDFDGDLDISLPGPGSGTEINNIATDVKVVFPQLVSFSASWQTSEKLMLATRVAWEEWSQLDSIPVSTSNAGARVPLEWDDVWSFSLGLQYRPQGRYTWYTGVGYDSDPTEARYRLPILPADEQWRFSGGLTRDLDNDRRVGLSVTYVDLGDARIQNTSEAGTFSGEYKTNRVLIVGVNYAF